MVCVSHSLGSVRVSLSLTVLRCECGSRVAEAILLVRVGVTKEKEINQEEVTTHASPVLREERVLSQATERTRSAARSRTGTRTQERVCAPTVFAR